LDISVREIFFHPDFPARFFVLKILKNIKSLNRIFGYRFFLFPVNVFQVITNAGLKLGYPGIVRAHPFQ